jgi:quinoprotein glucose dehydrogenase
MPWVLTMIDIKDKPNAEETNLGSRAHEMQGGEIIPLFTGIDKKYNESQFEQLVSSGRRMMPAFGQLAESEKKALASFILNLKKDQNQNQAPPN